MWGFSIIFVGPRSILYGHWCTLCDSAHGFKARVDPPPPMVNAILTQKCLFVKCRLVSFDLSRKPRIVLYSFLKVLTNSKVLKERTSPATLYLITDWKSIASDIFLIKLQQLQQNKCISHFAHQSYRPISSASLHFSMLVWTDLLNVVRQLIFRDNSHLLNRQKCVSISGCNNDRVFCRNIKKINWMLHV